jgi:hypothetical protein
MSPRPGRMSMLANTRHRPPSAIPDQGFFRGK